MLCLNPIVEKKKKKHKPKQNQTENPNQNKQTHTTKKSQHIKPYFCVWHLITNSNEISTLPKYDMCLLDTYLTTTSQDRLSYAFDP